MTYKGVTIKLGEFLQRITPLIRVVRKEVKNDFPTCHSEYVIPIMHCFCAGYSSSVVPS